MEPPPEGCPLCGSTWGDWWEDVDGQSVFFCCELCARQWISMNEEVKRRTGWPRVDWVDVDGNRWGRTCTAHHRGADYAFFVVFTPEGELRKFEDRSARSGPAAEPSRGETSFPGTQEADLSSWSEPESTDRLPESTFDGTEPVPDPAPPVPQVTSAAELSPPPLTVPPPPPDPAAEWVDGLHPALRARLDEEAREYPNLIELPVEEGRQVVRRIVRETDRLAGGPAAVAQLKTTSFAAGDHRIPVRVYTPVDGDPPLPVVVYFHGGGWVFGDLDTHDSVCREVANRGHCLVVSVGYRRSPESRFPDPVDDCFAAVKWMVDPDTVGRLQSDPRRLIVAGDSVGGNMAAVVSLLTKELGGPKLAGQILICPVIDYFPQNASYREKAKGFGLDAEFFPWMWSQYLRTPDDGRDPHVVPALAADLSGLPPALVITAECDVLRDEGEQFADRLEASGVPVQASRYAGMIHGFIDYRGIVEEGWDALDEIGSWIRSTVGDGPPPPPPPPP
ncbi:MAG TPA: TA0938 family protein [Thermoplasmata archaeon]